MHVKAYKAGVGGLIYPRAYGGTRPDDFDAFHEMILWDEIGRAGGGAVLWQLGVNSMALPPVINYGSDYLKDLVVRNVVTGKMNMSLAISEPTAGSDVANLQTTAKRQGDHYVINGVKKWITGGMVADYFTCAVRTGGPGMKGLSLILIPKTAKGLRVRKMKTQFDSSISTTMVFLDDVVVPVRNLIGKENQGFKMIVKNFNHERFIIACQYCRMARLAYVFSSIFCTHIHNNNNNNNNNNTDTKKQSNTRSYVEHLENVLWIIKSFVLSLVRWHLKFKLFTPTWNVLRFSSRMGFQILRWDLNVHCSRFR